MIVIRLK